jgi:hypothetical protein
MNFLIYVKHWRFDLDGLDLVGFDLGGVWVV